jgi:hypothetical protein
MPVHCNERKKNYKTLIENKDKNVNYLFMFYFFINFNSYNLFMMIMISIINLISLII